MTTHTTPGAPQGAALPDDAPTTRPHPADDAAPSADRRAFVSVDAGHPAPAARGADARGRRRAQVTGPQLEVVRTPAGAAALTRPSEEIVPGRPLPPLRILRVPQCEPADEPEYVPPGAAVIPFPVPPPVTEQPVLRLVGASFPAPPCEPDPAEARRQVHRFAVALAEVLSGARALRQLGDRVTPEVRERIAHLRQDLGTRQVTGVSLVASNATAPTDDTAEGFLRLRLAGPDRFQAVAVRLDRQTPRARPDRPHIWVCTALHHR